MATYVLCSLLFASGLGTGIWIGRGQRRSQAGRYMLGGIELPDENDPAWKTHDVYGECAETYCRGTERLKLESITICAECSMVFLGTRTRIGKHRRYRDRVLSGILRKRIWRASTTGLGSSREIWWPATFLTATTLIRKGFV